MAPMNLKVMELGVSVGQLQQTRPVLVFSYFSFFVLMPQPYNLFVVVF